MVLSKKEREILKTFESVIPSLTEREKDRLLYIGEGMALITERLKSEKENKKDKEVV